MSGAAPTLQELHAHAEEILARARGARAVGFRCQGRWTGAADQVVGHRQYRIAQCETPLAVRLALRGTPADSVALILTWLDDTDLGDDIRLRLAKSKLFRLDPWNAVLAAFQARTLDPRLSGLRWLPSALLELVPRDSIPPARGGFLDAEVVWPLLLHHAWKLSADPPDLGALLRWSTDREAVGRFHSSSAELREGGLAWLEQQLGAVAGHVVRSSAKIDGITLGVVVGILHHPLAAGTADRCLGKLEERFQLGQLAPETARRWGNLAADLVRGYPAGREQEELLARVDGLLTELQAERLAIHSDLAPLGFAARLEHAGKALSIVLQTPITKTLEALGEACAKVEKHDLARLEPARVQRLAMAHRLVRWLQTPAGEPASFDEAALAHLRVGGHVDWARRLVSAGDPVAPLAAAYSELLQAVAKRREIEARVFAERLVDWSAAARHDGPALPVETILDRVVAPLAHQRRVLLIVLDGMSLGVCRELLADILRRDWNLLAPGDQSAMQAGIATIPSATQFSRTSLLCGRLATGTSTQEVAGFAEHPALRAASRASHPPLLFHKAAIRQGSPAYVDEVQREISADERQIVGVVLNAIDDQLAKGDQLQVAWTKEVVARLTELLQAARDSERLVIITSDHGHVLGARRSLGAVEGGERWRPAGRALAPEELEVRGPRVLVSGGQLVAPWSEHVQYGATRHGYHGGLSPQEMVVPIVVLAAGVEPPEGWREAALDAPEWWDAAPVITPQPLTPREYAQRREPQMQITFPDSTAPVPDYIERLLASPFFAQQRQRAGRAAPAPQEIGRVLQVLEAHGCKVLTAALERACQIPSQRLDGYLAMLQRILNIDGYAVLNREGGSDTIELNRSLLLTQFELD